MSQTPIVIAHRGASGYLPEHTLPAKAAAHAMGADYIEQDVVLTKDNVPVVLHDVHLDTVTDVAKQFPVRKRRDGRYYAIDFTLAEIKTLRAHERVDHRTGKQVYPKRFPKDRGVFRVPTLAEEIELIQGMNESGDHEAGIYPELKQPEFHHKEGKDIAKIVLSVLDKYGYRSKRDKCFVQCFDAKETRRLKEELGCELRIIQLLGNRDWTVNGYLNAPEVSAKLGKIAQYADGIGPPIDQLISRVVNGRVQPGPIMLTAKRLKLDVHPYTFRADDLPTYAAGSTGRMTHILFQQLKVSGVFTDFPDIVLKARSAVR